MYKNLEKVYIRNINAIGEPLDNKLYVTNDNKLYVWNGNIEEMQELSTGGGTGDVYTKAEVDALLAKKANTDSVYNKGEVDTKLNDKANTADIYNKSQVDSKLADKADKSALDAKANSADVYKKTETYSKAEIDTKLDSKADKSDLDTKADKDTVYDKSEVDSKLNSKANTSDVYKKDEVYTKKGVDDRVGDHLYGYRELKDVPIGTDTVINFSEVVSRQTSNFVNLTEDGIEIIDHSNPNRLVIVEGVVSFHNTHTLIGDNMIGITDRLEAVKTGDAGSLLNAELNTLAINVEKDGAIPTVHNFPFCYILSGDCEGMQLKASVRISGTPAEGALLTTGMQIKELHIHTQNVM